MPRYLYPGQINLPSLFFYQTLLRARELKLWDALKGQPSSSSQASADTARAPRVHFVSSYFYSRLFRTGGCDDRKFAKLLENETRNYNLLDCDLILVPVHKPGHWVLGVINVKVRAKNICLFLRSPITPIFRTPGA